MRFITGILTWLGNIFIVLVIILVLSAIITIVSFGITFGARSGWQLSAHYVEQQCNIEHVDE